MQGKKENHSITKTYTTYGKCNSDLTANAAVETAKKIQTMPQGYHYMEKVMELEDLKIPVVIS